ncbi:MAG: hypothetical protein U9P36_15310 [Thermodesulfobacteriota bacterium]|nr:hypothetical protein [Thermodesulfobacteriota bacterium]
MQTITRLIVEQGLADRFIRTSQLVRLVDGTANRRYGLVNRAIKTGELIQIQRGLYMLSKQYRIHPSHPFALAQAIVPGSYISFETALAYHGWIPEKVFSTASVLPGRQSYHYENEELGAYSFYPLAVHRNYFLELVNRYRIDEQTMLVAEPCRALLDLICLRKIEWKGLAWLLEGLRIDSNALDSIRRKDLKILQQVYKHKRMKAFLSTFLRELGLE